MTATPQFRVLATCSSFEPGFRGGGPVRSLAQIVDTVPADVTVTLVTRDRDLGSARAYPGLSGRWISRGSSRVCYLNTRSPAQWWRLLREVRRAGVDLLYVNSFWEPVLTMIPILAVRLGLVRPGQLLLAPRGELGPAALSIKSGRKRLMMRLWKPVLRGLDVTWQASSAMEEGHIRQHFPAARVLVNSDQASLPETARPPAPTGSAEARFVFLSRLAPMKNLRGLIAGMQRCSRPVALDVYGPIEDRRYFASCLALATADPLTAGVSYRGEVASHDVAAVFSGYDAFLFPTLGENFGHVIVESLASSCPVVCSDRTPWGSTLRTGGGWVLPDLQPQTIAGVLDDIAAASAESRLARRFAAGAAYEAWLAGSCRHDHIFDAVRAVGSR